MALNFAGRACTLPSAELHRLEKEGKLKIPLEPLLSMTRRPDSRLLKAALSVNKDSPYSNWGN